MINKDRFTNWKAFQRGGMQMLALRLATYFIFDKYLNHFSEFKYTAENHQYLKNKFLNNNGF